MITSRPVWSGLLAFYKLSDLTDSSGNNRTLTNNGNVSFASGKIGNAAVFDGSTNNLKSSYVVPYSTSDVTLSLWLKASALSQWRTFFGSPFNTGTPRVNFGTTDADQIFINNAGSGPVLTLSNYTVDDTWQHIVVVITNNGDSVKFYRAGNLVDELAGAELGSTEVWIGGGVGWPVEADPFNGQIDAVGIWNRALSPLNISALYNLGVGREI